jgi:primosomal protein N' (replication factor Y)
MNVARVVVDVPSRETDRPFDYFVPDRLKPWIEVGSRVAVPFGGRTLQGIVIALAERAEVGEERLKPVAEVLDATPPLTPELVELGIWMSRRWLCPLSVALQAMLPAALKGRTEKYVSAADGESWDEGERAAYGALISALERRGALRLSQLLREFPDGADFVRRALRSGRLVETQRVEDRVSVRTVPTVFPPEEERLREALERLPARAAKQREAVRWLLERAERGPVPVRELAEAAGVSPAVLRALAAQGWLEIREVPVNRDPYAGRVFRTSSALPLTPAQQSAFAPLAAAIERGEGGVFLLHGVTGSGKTELYLQAIQKCLERGLEAIVLVPEIALTPQMAERFKSRFGADVAVLHSRLSDGERYDEWRKIREGRARVALGARSAVFAPFRRLGLIVVDEEHETSYKQEDNPKYHARDVAVERARHSGAVVILGSATPSLETYAAATGLAEPSGAFAPSGSSAVRPRYLRLAERIGNRPLPSVRIVDMREELRRGNRAMFSRDLAEALRERLGRGEQTVLLLNRRGHSTFVMCRSCGFTAACPHCDISLTYHRGSGNLRCHYCGYAEPEKTACPACASPHIRYFGTGTQKAEEYLAAAFPGVRVIRMDLDTTTEKGSHEKWLTLFRERQADVLLGTQMVAKGLDFPHVTLVGVLAADATLRLPDFRSWERTFQLLTQVAGRAGRHELPGEVIIQTYDPDHVSVVCARRHDYEGFAAEELRHRRLLGYPPYGRLISVVFAHARREVAMEAGESFAGFLRSRAEAMGLSDRFDATGAAALDVLGPAAAPVARLKDRYRIQCVVKYRGDVDAQSLVSAALEPLGGAMRRGALQVSVDVDPQIMM